MEETRIYRFDNIAQHAITKSMTLRKHPGRETWNLHSLPLNPTYNVTYFLQVLDNDKSVLTSPLFVLMFVCLNVSL